MRMLAGGLFNYGPSPFGHFLQEKAVGGDLNITPVKEFKHDRLAIPERSAVLEIDPWLTPLTASLRNNPERSHAEQTEAASPKSARRFSRSP